MDLLQLESKITFNVEMPAAGRTSTQIVSADEERLG